MWRFNDFLGWSIAGIFSALVSSYGSVLLAVELERALRRANPIPGYALVTASLGTLAGTGILLTIVSRLLFKRPDSDVVEEDGYQGIITGHTVRLSRRVVTRMDKRVSFHMILWFVLPGMVFDLLFASAWWQGLCWPYYLWAVIL
ncbi:hypothetical protein [Nitrospirillum iridis]|uniref:Uncharacterized protein n=1 Tax=Nitrospirillum iridis TaxID=765888 RepID=A0A7X0AW50_9PROT|nr:hypothetical protein [Nitrospirillum iridis]MBB6251227.1 hypothetical protein [Nitrospirillum iridis]